MGAGLLALLAGCGGGDPAATEATEATADPAQAADSTTVSTFEVAQAATPAQPTIRADAFRLLTQASFGPTEAEIQRVMSIGPAAWIDAQMALPVQGSHLSRWLADDAAARARNPGLTAGGASVASSFYQQALFGQDQLRQRVAFALSEIMVVSSYDMSGRKAVAVASYLDMLRANALGNYRQLIEKVALHPAMGMYLSHLKNRKGDPVGGREPDQNFARELMQLFSVGLVALNADGTPRLVGGRPLENYGPDDVEGLSQVMTGFSWAGPDTSSARFSTAFVAAGDAAWRPMQGYPAFHETQAKHFLGTTVAAQATAQPALSLRQALDTLAAHPSVGPFIGRQLIQRLVTSQPSRAYVARISAVWANNGAGVRGDLRAVVRAILLDPEARSAATAASPAFGKLREPVLRQTALLRALGAKSDSGQVLMEVDDDPASGLGQTPMRSPTVFNFFRPGHVPMEGQSGALGMTVPEWQTTTEVSVAGYVNHVARLLTVGVGTHNRTAQGTRPDLHPDLSALLALAGSPTQLVEATTARLLGPSAPAALKTLVLQGVTGIAVPALKADGSNRAKVNDALLRRVQAAVLITAASPEFIVQR
ncbi:DUF1800 domain-containing protein [Ideonella aquatica]|uniref:DUF1800 domain-containing protein n=1 Tax=Ideonella aquatica TaxID=2824119 RepID=UPI002872CE3E|nr:DUF1800 domain-containing protein [Ideonella aquatica]